MESPKIRRSSNSEAVRKGPWRRLPACETTRKMTGWKPIPRSNVTSRTVSHRFGARWRIDFASGILRMGSIPPRRAIATQFAIESRSVNEMFLLNRCSSSRHCAPTSCQDVAIPPGRGGLRSAMMSATSLMLSALTSTEQMGLP